MQGRIRGDRVLIYLGVIDILQSYRFKKKLEHSFKSIIADGVSFTTVQCSYRIAGNFQMVEIFVLKSIIRKLKLTKISLHNTVNMFYVTMLSCTNIYIKIGIRKFAPTKITRYIRYSYEFSPYLPPQNTVSVHNPSYYARRFQDFITTQVFKKEKSK